MTRDINNIMTRLMTVIMLMIFSVGAKADVKILYGEKGTEKFEGSGGKIEVTQKESDDKTQVTVYLTVTPDNGYTMAKDGIKLYATIPANAGSTRAPEVSAELTPQCEDFKGDTQKRTYYVKIASNLALWVKSVKFESASKGGESTREIKVPDGIYYIQNNSTTNGYLWPSLTTNTTTGYRYLTTSWTTSVEAVDNNNGVSYPAHDKSYSHWVVKNVNGEYIQLINPRLNKYVVIRQFPKEDNTKQSAYGDRDVWLTDEPAAENIEYTYFVLNNDNSHYRISPKPGLNNINNTSGYTFNSAGGSDRKWLTWSGTGNSDKPQNGEDRLGLIQLYTANPNGTPAWSFTSDLLDQPNISDVDANSIVTVTDANGLPDGYKIRYTTDGSDPDASSPIMEGNNYTVTSSFTLKAVVERYGIVLTKVAEKAVAPAPCATPVITYDNTTSNVSISCTTPNSTIYYTIDGSTPATSSTLYSAPFSVDGTTTVKAIATHATFDPSAVAELAISQVATPTIQNNGSNAISIKSATPEATIYYTIDGSTPTTSSAEYTEPLTENVSNVTIKAIAVKENMITSEVGSGKVMLQCATPVITRDGMTFTLSCSFPTDATLYYILGDHSEEEYTGTPVSFTATDLPMTVTAVARHNDYSDSGEASMELVNGSGTSDDPYLIYGITDFTNFVTNVNNETTASAFYKLETDVSGSGVDAITKAFTGTFDGGMHIISGLGHALFNTVNGGVVKNVILDNVGISGGENVGAICNEATGDTRIYNCGILATGSTAETDDDGYTKITSCSSSVSGSGYVGGIVGLLDGSSRVINCFSYAEIKSGNYVGGIVGYNNVATTSAANNLKTMVMNCMFYGNITGGTNKAPIYNGEIISNVGNTGVGNYNYFLADASFTNGIDTYNCALMAEKRFLQRFEFFRHLLNGHRELAGWWATGTFSKTEIAKWVMEPSQLGTSTPYPILKAQGKYPSVVNYDAENTPNTTERNKGRKLGTLTVNIQMGDGAVYTHPGTGDTEAKITTSRLALNITDKDPDHFNFNYYKVQLPYYNDVGTKNYTGNRVVTGWKIVSISGGTTYFTTGSDAETNASGEITKAPYNFADRNCTEKDLYSKSGRVFAQGAYFDVPEGVTSITIEPYWAKCVYLADANADVVYNTNMGTAYSVPNVGGGKIYNNGNSYSIAGDNQLVYTTMSDAISSTNSTGLFVGIEGDANNHTVYDYAVVLVGNYHNYNSIEASNSKPYTVTSIDLDGDNEPDYSYILRFDSRKILHPVRVDFINIPGLGMAQKSTGGTGSYNFGIFQPKSWFESTNTSLFRITQFEYEKNDREAKPLILHGGVIEQWVSGQSGGNGQKTTYIHVGSNVWFKEFHLGCHQDATLVTKHPPVSVTGGDYNEFYLTGLYSAAGNCDDNAECYINGGRFDKVAGTGIEGIGHATNHTNGNIVWQIQNADIEEFYGGGINATKPMQGNITTVITGSHVKRFCGGPKFGDMNPDRTVITTATDCTFGSFFGAGYGGNSYYRAAPGNFTDQSNYEWNNWIAGTVKGNVKPTGSSAGDYPGGITYNGYQQDYISNFGGVSTRFDYQFLPQSDNVNNVGRLFIDFVNFSLATTRNVTSTLTGCTITGNFYGGGSLGKVDGNVSSTLTDCTVRGSVFGGGYDASRPTVQVMSTDGFLTPPKYDTNTGAFFPAEEPYNTSIEYRWEHSETVNSTETAIKTIETEAGTEHILYTTADLTTLGQVTGNVALNILGNTLVEGLSVDYEGNLTGSGRGGVFGGGDASAVLGNTTVTINASALQDGATYNAYRVYGGGNSAPVGGNSTVTLRGKTQVLDNVFGGGNEGEVGGNATVNIE